MSLESTIDVTQEQDNCLASWQQQFQQAIRDPVALCQTLNLPESYHVPAKQAARLFPVFAPRSYVQRMKPADPEDPLLRQVLPLGDELEELPGFSTDPVGDQTARQAPGMIRKYQDRALLITTGMCAIHCRYCFRRHYPYGSEPKSREQWQPAIEYLAHDTSIHEVILSGGDPLSLSDEKLATLADALKDIPHLRRLRVHSRLPIVIPARVTENLMEWLGGTRLQGYLVVHANHANEINDEVTHRLRQVARAGITVLNQAVLLRGVNDSVDALLELCRMLANHGVFPYYLNQLDRVQGAAHFEVPVSQGKRLISELRELLPGYAVPRYVQEVPGEPHKVVLM